MGEKLTTEFIKKVNPKVRLVSTQNLRWELYNKESRSLVDGEKVGKLRSPGAVLR
jgi:hypothetical protein